MQHRRKQAAGTLEYRSSRAAPLAVGSAQARSPVVPRAPPAQRPAAPESELLVADDARWQGKVGPQDAPPETPRGWLGIMIVKGPGPGGQALRKAASVGGVTRLVSFKLSGRPGPRPRACSQAALWPSWSRS